MLAYDTLDAVEAAVARAKTKNFSCIITSEVAIEFLMKHYGADGDMNIDKLPYALMHPSGDHSDEDFDEDAPFDESKTEEENRAEYDKDKEDAEDYHLLFTDTQQGDLAKEISVNPKEWRKIAQKKATKEQIEEYVNGREIGLWQIWKR